MPGSVEPSVLHIFDIFGASNHSNVLLICEESVYLNEELVTSAAWVLLGVSTFHLFTTLPYDVQEQGCSDVESIFHSHLILLSSTSPLNNTVPHDGKFASAQPIFID